MEKIVIEHNLPDKELYDVLDNLIKANKNNITKIKNFKNKLMLNKQKFLIQNFENDLLKQIEIWKK